MRRSTRRIAMLSFLTCLAIGVGAAEGSITYDIVDDPTVTAPYVVSGTITTNGVTGSHLGVTNIIAWDVTVTDGSSTVFALTIGNSVVEGNGFDADMTSLSVSSSNNSSDNLLFSNFTNTIEWSASVGPPPYGSYSGSSGQNTLWHGSSMSEPLTVASVASAVPEPPTAMLALFGAGAGGVYGLVRKCRERRRLATA